MSRALRVFSVLLLVLPFATRAFAIAGATDRKPAASLLVPFFETGIDVATNPQDTLLVVTSTWMFPVTIHYHVWDIDGNATALYGNITLTNSAWSAAMRDRLNASTPAVRAQLTDGAFYRGFVTIDLVTAATALNPRQAGYPFDSSNLLEGQIYYTRLSQGSANGLAMVAIEGVNPATFTALQGFYAYNDAREEIDSLARVCTQELTDSGDCSGADDNDIDRFHLRVFRSTPLNGSSRAVVFTWIQGVAGGPSVYCDADPCASDYIFRQYNEAGTVVQDTTIRLDHVVNLIPDSALLGTEAGYISILDVPNCNIDTQVYAFSFNSANPGANPSLTWDAIFEGFIVP